MTNNRINNCLNLYIGIKRLNFELESIARKDVRAHGLSVNEFAVLELLFHRGEQTVQDIRNKILVANSSTTYILDQLCKRNLTLRIPDENDRRTIYVHLTDEGRELIESLFPDHAKVIKEYFDDLDDEEIKVFHELIKKVTNYKK